jgi:hypothetical protein
MTALEAVPPRQRLAKFIAKFDPKIGALTRAALARMRKRLPGATRIVYDNYNALAIGFSPTERTSDTIFSIAVFPRWISLFFFNGTELTDPQRLLKGNGKMARHIVLDTPALLDTPAVRALIAEALTLADPPFTNRGRGRLVIKSVSRTQRPRRPRNRP